MSANWLDNSLAHRALHKGKGTKTIMRTLNKAVVHLILVALLVNVASSTRAQDRPVDLVGLKKNASYQEAIDWLKLYWFSSVGIGIDDRVYPKDEKFSRAFSFFKGFKLTESEKCVLTLRNEGNYQDKAKTHYVAIATLPLSDLSYQKAKILSRPPFKPSIDEGYGLWEAQFTSTKYDLNILIKVEDSEKKTYAGSVLKFTFLTKDGAVTFSKAFLQLIKKCHK